MDDAPKHAPLLFPIREGHVLAGGRSVAHWADELQTPFFLYDRSLIEQRIADLRAHLPDQLSLHYAIKANPFAALLDFMQPLVDGFDVASGGELQLALDAGMDAGHISFAGPGKTDAELELAVRSGITLNAESEGEIERLARIGRKAGRPVRLALRINPAFEVRQSGMKMGGGPRQFGIDEEEVPDVLSRLDLDVFEFRGFHIFAGSQILREDVLIEIQQQTVDLAIRLAKDAPGPVAFVNLGGGFGIPYFPGEERIDIQRLGQALKAPIERARTAMPDAVLAIELGRFLVGEAGLYVSRFVDRKVSRGRTFLVTDGGLHHHLALSGNFGQVIRKNYPVLIEGRAGHAADETVDVVGCLCTPLDRLADQVALPRAEVGDLFVVFQSGAYAASASPSAFLEHPPAEESLV